MAKFYGKKGRKEKINKKWTWAGAVLQCLVIMVQYFIASKMCLIGVQRHFIKTGLWCSNESRKFKFKI